MPISQFLVKYTNKVKTKKETGNALDGDSALQLAKQLRPQRVVAVAGPGGRSRRLSRRDRDATPVICRV